MEWDAIADTVKRTNDKNDRKYMKYIREGKLRVAKQMVHQAAKMNGYTIKAYRQTSAVFAEFSTANPVAGKNDSETFNGIFFNTNDHDIGFGGGIQMEVYVLIGLTRQYDKLVFVEVTLSLRDQSADWSWQSPR